MNLPRLLLALAVLIALAVQSPGQTPLALPAAGPAPAAAAMMGVEVEAAVAEDAAAGHPQAGGEAQAAAEKADATEDEQKAKAAAEQRKQQRLQKINKLPFDRRPSSILGAWSEVPEADVETEPEKASPQDAPQAPEAAEADPFDDEIKRFQRSVTLGDWTHVKQYLADLPEDEGQALYRRLLGALLAVPAQTAANAPPEVQAQLAQFQQMQAQQRGRQPEKHTLTFDDVLAIADARPVELDRQMIQSLGAMLRQALSTGAVIDQLTTRLRSEVAEPEQDGTLTERQATQLLFAAGRPIEAGEFLPPIDQARREDDFEALNLLSQHLMAIYAAEKKIEHLERAWHVTQAVLAAPQTEKKEREEALRQAVELAPQIRDELGQHWLAESFAGQPQRGIEILASIGASAAKGLETNANNPPVRLTGLKLQTTAVEALLRAAPERAGEWRDTLSLLASNWLNEAILSYQLDQSDRRGPSLQRDIYGNFFYADHNQYAMASRARGRIQPIQTGDILEIKPSADWLALVHNSLQPKFQMVYAQLYLKVNEEDQAFPYIEQLASVYPEMAQDLVDEFLRVWTQNHDPNASRNRTNYYMFMYGYERKAESIPLTRSKQERNLRELSELVKRLRALPLEELNEQLLARAFTTCHSSAEVYRLEAIERVFGSLDDVEPETLAELTQQMRSNLVGVWRQPAVQKDNKTNRKQKDIQAEILRGYRVADAVIQRGLAKYPDHWALHLSQAALDHDHNNYLQELSPNAEFSGNRDDAFAQFEEAAVRYAASLQDMDQEEETTRAFELWFYASLGACDLQHVVAEKVPDLRQPSRIREALQGLPDAAAERHLAMFANTLFTRMSAVKPAVKYRYVRTGLEIVGDHKQAREARKVFDYYNDLVTEIKLETVVDGSDFVGHREPFGVFVNLRHTREIERESGGFGRYLQNQNTSNNFYYNYGRPLENYRDKFEEIVQQSLQEHFQVLSVTFQSEDVNSKSLEEYGWRVTPYAYLLLQARGAEVDKIPPLRLDLDFLDTSGYAVIPIESPAVPIDATADRVDARPLQNLSITQTLDERQADEGKLILEVKASGQGLVPDLPHILDLAPAGFKIEQIDDQGLSVSRFDPDSDETVIVAERSWMVSMQAEDDLPQRPTSFEFGTAKLDTSEMVFQRYDDADLLAVEREISLVEAYGTAHNTRIWVLAGGSLLMVGLLVLAVLSLRPAPRVDQTRFEMPDTITPFTVLGLLRDIETHNGLNTTGKEELAQSIHCIERHFFMSSEGVAPDLRQIAADWIRRAR